MQHAHICKLIHHPPVVTPALSLSTLTAPNAQVEGMKIPVRSRGKTCCFSINRAALSMLLVNAKYCICVCVVYSTQLKNTFQEQGNIHFPYRGTKIGSLWLSGKVCGWNNSFTEQFHQQRLDCNTDITHSAALGNKTPTVPLQTWGKSSFNEVNSFLLFRLSVAYIFMFLSRSLTVSLCLWNITNTWQSFSSRLMGREMKFCCQ